MTPEVNQPVSMEPAPTESGDRGSTVPLWLIALMSLLLFWGFVHFDDYGGWFSPKVYTPYRSLTELERYQPRAEGVDLRRGKAVFDLTCSLCHGTDGLGKPGQAPSLVGSEWVTGSPERVIRIPLYGVTGPITVNGQPWTGQSSMPAMGAALSSEDLAAALSYIRQSWGNQAEPITPEQVEAVRAEVGTRTQQFTVEELQGIQ